MTVKVIQLENLGTQVTKLEETLKIYEKQWKKNNETLITHELEAEIEALVNFRQDFESLLSEVATIDGQPQRDIYDNLFSGPYRYAEVTYTSYEKFDTVRLLGSDGLNAKRFYFSEVFHNFSPNTISLIVNIRDIIREPFNLDEFINLCGKNFKESNADYIKEKTNKKTRYTWEEVSREFFIPPAKTEISSKLTDESRESLQKKYDKKYSSKQDLISRNRKIQQEKNRLYKKALEDKEQQDLLSKKIKKELELQKKENDYKKILNTVGKFVDKYSFACLVKEALECVVPKNINCEQLFKDLSANQIMDRLAAIFPRGNDTLREIENLIEKNLFSDVGKAEAEVRELRKILEGQEARLICLSCEDTSADALDVLEQEIQNNKALLSTKENELNEKRKNLYDDLSLTERQRQLANNGGNLFSVISSYVNEEEKAGAFANADRVLKIIDTVIPLEDLCNLLTQSLSNGFDLSSFKFPELRPINDIFSGFSLEIEAAFLQAIVQAIIILIETILNDLFNCDNLDNLVAAAVSGVNENFSSLSNLDVGTAATNIGSKIAENSSKFGAYSDLVTLFGGSTPNLSQSFGKNYENFINNITSLTQQAVANVVKVNPSRRGILDYLFSQNTDSNLSKWTIDSSGEKFVISDGIRIIDIEDIDKSINSTVNELLRTFPPELITEELLLLIKDANESGNISLAPSSVSQPLEIDNNAISSEMSNVVGNFIAIASPTEVINIISGNASEQTIDLAFEIMSSFGPNLSKIVSNKLAVRNLFLQFGKATGLDELLPKINLVSSLPESNLKLVPPKLCAPFNNVDTFRKALMTRAVPLQTAEAIMDNLNSERIKKYNELIDSLLVVSTGNIPEKIKSNPKAKFLNDVRTKILKPALETPSEEALETTSEERATGQEEDLQNKKDFSDTIRGAMNEKTSSSPIYNSMTEMTLSSIFEPIRQSFDSDMQGYIDSMSKEVQKETIIPRQIYVKDKDNKSIKVLNPEFKDFINAGLVPIVEKDEDKYAKMVDKSVLEIGDEGKIDDTRVTGNPNSDFLKPSWSLKRLGKDLLSLGFEDPERVKKPILKTISKKIVGENFKNNIISGFNNNLSIKLNQKSFRITIKDFESTNSVLSEKSADASELNIFDKIPEVKMAMENNKPKWTIEFVEERRADKERAVLLVDPSGVSVNPINGVQNFYSPILDVQTKFFVDNKKRNILNERRYSYEGTLLSKAEVFQKFFVQQLPEANSPQRQREQFRIFSLPKQRIMIERVLESLSENLKESRLFKETGIEGENIQQTPVFLQLFDFTRSPTDLEKECNFDPHIMGFEQLYKEFKEIYENEPEVQQSEASSNGLSNKKTRLGNAALKISSKVLVRLITVDFVLKTIPIFDSFKYTKHFSEVNVLSEMLLNNAISQIKEMGIYETFKQEMKRQISQEPKKEVRVSISRNVIEDCRDIIETRSQYTDSLSQRAEESEECAKKAALEAQQQALIDPTMKREVSEGEYRQALRDLLNGELEQILEKVSRLFSISSNEREQDYFIKFFVDGLKLYDVHQDGSSVFMQDKSSVQYKKVLNTSLSISDKLKRIKNSNKTNVEKLFELSILLEQQGKNAQELTESLWIQEDTPTITSEIVENVKKGDLYLERYARVPLLNESFREESEYEELLAIEDSVVPITILKTVLSRIASNEGEKVLYNCDSPETSVFSSPPSFGLRLNYVYDDARLSEDGRNYFFINTTRYPLSDRQIREKLLVANENDFQKTYLLLNIDQQEQEVATTLSIEQFLQICDKDFYDETFFPTLKDRIIKSENSNIMFGYCIPIREIATIALVHAYLSNNGEKQKYLFEPTKRAIKNVFETIGSLGNKTGGAKALQNMRARQKEEINNEGNPAGPLNFDALKIYLRTPIHILRGLASTVDPNIFIADKIVAGAAAAGSLINKKIYLPYSLASLALLPFPIFTGPPPIGIGIPFSAYNITLPLGPIFLALEPLLWDLPWFKNINGDPNNPNRNALEKFGIRGQQDICKEEGQEVQTEDEVDDILFNNDTIQYLIEQIKKSCNV